MDVVCTAEAPRATPGNRTMIAHTLSLEIQSSTMQCWPKSMVLRLAVLNDSVKPSTLRRTAGEVFK